VQKARDAVEQRDYRLALSYAIDARQPRAGRRAPGEPSAGSACSKPDIEALYSEVGTRANRLQASCAKPPRPLTPGRRTSAAARATLAERARRCKKRAQRLR
jgi:hypothetical protein